jgi:hypothetical protein
VAGHGLSGHTEDLLAVWSRFVDAGQKIDPGCSARESALTALDVLEWFDPDPFLAAIGCTQVQDRRPTGIAGGRRAVRLGSPDVWREAIAEIDTP